jgi:hypothetical protein
MLPASAGAQDLPVSAGTIEVQAGMAAIGLPEATNGTYSAQPELRLGFFLVEGLEAQLEANIRMWPLGSVAPHSAGAAAHLAWYPSLGPGHRNLYLLAGGGVSRNDPPGVLTVRTFDPLARAGLGYKIPLSQLGMGAVPHGFFTTEFRAEMHFEEQTDIVSGIVAAFSYFL